MAKPLSAPPPDVPSLEDQDDECPKCPSVGAPAWMATFADIATLLVGFFVLILSFAEFNQPRFKMIAGSLQQAFGIQRLVPVIEQPEGTTSLDMKFSPSPEPSLTEDMTQQSSVTDRDDLGTEMPQQESEENKSDPQQQEMAENLQAALTELGSDLTVSSQGGQVTIDFPEVGSDNAMEKIAEQLAQAAQAIDQVGADQSDININGLTDQLGSLAQVLGGSESDIKDGGNSGTASRRAEIAEEKMRVALREQIDSGLVDVEREENKIHVTVGAGGAFPSGSAELTDKAREIMAGLALSNAGGSSTITVTGHTDNVPLAGGQFTDNWGLAAGRAASVVRELGATGLVDPARLSAVSKGESEPVADNNSLEGRELNRRVEIEINYDGQ